MPDIKEMATRPVGPLPAYAWVLVVVGGYFGYRILSGRSSSSTSSETVGATSSGSPGSADALTTSVSLNNLAQEIANLGNKISGGTGSGSTALKGTLTPGDTAIRLIDTATGKLIKPSQTVYDLGQAIMTSRGPAHLVTQDGKTYALLDRNFSTAAAAASAATAAIFVPTVNATKAIGSTAQQVLPGVAPTPIFGNGTAIPRPVAIATPISNDLSLPRPALPTIGKAIVPGRSFNISATTPKAPKVAVAKAKGMTQETANDLRAQHVPK
jgi:hypothetical protein